MTTKPRDPIVAEIVVHADNEDQRLIAEALGVTKPLTVDDVKKWGALLMRTELDTLRARPERTTAKPLYSDNDIYQCARRHGVSGMNDQADTLNGANVGKAMLELRSFYEGKLADINMPTRKGKAKQTQ